MNNLFATWHRSDLDVVDHLTHAHDRLVGIPELEWALAMVDGALAQVSAWTGAQAPLPGSTDPGGNGRRHLPSFSNS